MKKSRLKFLAGALLMLGFTSFTSCSDSNSELEQGESTPDITGITSQSDADIQAVDSGYVSWHDHFNEMLKTAEAGNGPEDSLIAVLAKRRLAIADSLTDAYIDSLGANGSDHGWDGEEGKNGLLGYKYVNIRYVSVDKDNKPVQLSELIVFPYNKILPTPHPDNIIIGCHVTISSNNERPSNYGANSFSTDVGMLACHASSNLGLFASSSENLVIIPDYQGYGATHKDAHPYLYQSLTARQVIDGVIAGKKWFESNEKSLEDDYKTFSVGYSQGGSVSMAVQRYVEQNGLSSQLRFAGALCGDGPYDPLATLKKYIQDDKIYMPVAAGMIIKGMCDANPYVAGKYQPSDYFTDAFIKSGMMDWIASKNYTTNEVQEKLLNYSWNNSNGFVMKRQDKNDKKYYDYNAMNKSKKWENANDPGAAYCTVDQILRPEVIEYFKTGNVETQYATKMIAIEKALEMNNLCTGWIPSHPMIVFHSVGDEVVPFVNYESASKAFPDTSFRGIQYNTGTQSHVSTGTSFYARYESGYLSSLINNSWSKDYPNHDNWQYGKWY